jgi:hypothetical protein
VRTGRSGKRARGDSRAPEERKNGVMLLEAVEFEAENFLTLLWSGIKGVIGGRKFIEGGKSCPVVLQKIKKLWNTL